MRTTLSALIWDVDGTVAETERDGHRLAFNQAFEEFGLPWRWDVQTYGALLRVTGGFERLLYDMRSRAQAPSSPRERDRLAHSVHRRKNELYACLMKKGEIRARPGVSRLMDECESAGISQAVATTTSRANVEALFSTLFGAHWHERFVTVVCADDAPAKKPDPLVYRIALQRIGLDAGQVLAVEDSPHGLEAASSLGICTLITRSQYFAADAFPGAAGVCDDLDGAVECADGRRSMRIDVRALRAIHATWQRDLRLRAIANLERR